MIECNYGKRKSNTILEDLIKRKLEQVTFLDHLDKTSILFYHKRHIVRQLEQDYVTIIDDKNMYFFFVQRVVIIYTQA